MKILRAVEMLALPDWAIGAGFVRAAIWDHLHGYAMPTPLNDIDVLYFDPDFVDEERERELERNLRDVVPDAPWSVKNQARMHVRKGLPPHESTEDAMRYWLETPTAVGVRLVDGEMIFIAPFGTDDLLTMTLRPTPYGWTELEQYRQRVLAKPWRAQWPKLTVIGLAREIDGTQY